MLILAGVASLGLGLFDTWKSAALAQDAAGGPNPSPLCCKAADPACAPNEYSGIRVALVVGVDDYGAVDPPPGQLSNLKNARNDARELAGILSSSYQVRCILDPDATMFKSELKKLRDYLQPLQDNQDLDLTDNSVIIHFSGHGFQSSNSDFILLSGNFATKAAALRAAVPVFMVSDALEALLRFDIYLIFDSCRNRSDTGLVKPDWLEGFGEPKAYGKHGHTIVFGAGAGEFAYDKEERIGAKDNGALAFTLRKYFNFPAMRLREVFEVSMRDPSMLEIGQTPAIEPGRIFSDEPWTTHQLNCSAPEKAVARQVIDCRLSGGTTCIENQVCKKQLPKFDSFIQDNGGPSAACSRNKLFSTFAELGQRCTPLGPIAAILPVPAAAVPTANTLDQLHLNVLVSESATRIANTNGLGDLFARADQVSPKQGRDFLASQRRIVNASSPFSDAATTKLRVKDGPVELRLQPSEKSGTTGPLRPTAKPLVDCDTQPCTPQWVFARVPTAKGFIDGWLPTSAVEISPPSQSVIIDFRGDDFLPTRTSRENFRRIADSFRYAASAEITTSVSPDADARARAVAASRLAYVQNMISGLLSSEQVNTRMLPTDALAVSGQVKIQLFNR